MGDIWKLGAVELAASYRRREVTPSEVLAVYRERISRLDKLLNCYTILSDEAQEEAAQSSERIKAGKALSLLDGVPIAVKDNLVVRGMPAAWGSSVFADRICAQDELPVARLRAAGAIIIGKTNAPEFALEGYTANQKFGVTGNPWNPKLTPGGSSGGSVAAVAAGLAAVAICTDGGGSIRRPASYTCLLGLKPTIGRIARGGGLPQLLLDFEVVGPVARALEDVELVHSILAGPERVDPKSRAVAAAAKRTGPLRILFVEQIGDNPCDPEIRRSVRAAGEVLSGMGHAVVAGELPFALDELNAFWGTVSKVGLASLRAANADMRKNASPQFLVMADEGGRVLAREFWAGLEIVNRFRSDVSQAFADWDLIMTPSCAAQPWPADTAYPETIDGRAVGPRGHAIYTGWVNASGHPAIAVPAEPDRNGMPVGFQLVADLGCEDLLCQVARDFLGHREYRWRWPKLAEN
ncbi:MAG: amidase [Paracoccaceae bacterium]